MSKRMREYNQELGGCLRDLEVAIGSRDKSGYHFLVGPQGNLEGSLVGWILNSSEL
jgi:hypothetical protein